jgi:hypothetical protein
MSVTLIERPSAMQRSNAFTPALVPGILTMRLGRSTARQRRIASAMLLSVSPAKTGLTSMLTWPSAPPVRAKTGRNTSAAARMSSMARASKISSALLPALASRPSASS